MADATGDVKQVEPERQTASADHAHGGPNGPAPAEEVELGEASPLASNSARAELVGADPPPASLRPASFRAMQTLSPRDFHNLQRAFGNAAVAELVRRNRVVQRKPGPTMVGEPPTESEAAAREEQAPALGSQPDSLTAGAPGLAGLQPAVPPGQPAAGLPNGQPAGSPNGQSAGLPSGEATGLSAAQPAGLPKGQAPGLPTSQPAGLPGGQPAAVPGGLPSASPGAQPPALPNGHPAGAASAPPGGTPIVAPIRRSRGRARQEEGPGPGGGAGAGPGPASGDKAGAPPGPALPDTDFAKEVATQQDAIDQLAEKKNQQIRADATEQANAARQSIGAERARAEAIFTQATERIQQLNAQAVSRVQADRKANADAVEAAAAEQLAALAATIREKQAAVIQLGEAKARAAEAVGEQQAARALDGCHAKAYQALLLADRKAQQYASYNRAHLIGRTAHDIGSELAGRIQQAGQEMAAAARKDAADMAAKFRNEARQASDKLVEARAPAQAKIEQTKTETITSLGQMAEATIDQLSVNGRQAIAQQQAGKQAATADLQSLGDGAAASMTSAAESASRKVYHDAASARRHLSNVAHEFAGKLAGRGRAQQERRKQAQQLVESAVADFDASLDGVVQQFGSAMQQATGQVAAKSKAQTDQLNSQVDKSVADFGGGLSQTNEVVCQKMQAASGGARQAMQEAVTEARTQLDARLSEVDQTWSGQLREGTAKITEKIDQGLAKQEDAVAKLGPAIDKKADDIEHESIWSRIGGWIKGIAMGIFEELWDIVKVLLWVALGILIIIAILVIIVLIFPATLAAIVAGVIAVAGFLVAAGPYLLLLGALAIGVIVGIRLFQAIMHDDLTDIERGELVGRSITDILTLVFAETIFARLGNAVKGILGIEVGEDAVALARLRALVGDEALVQRLLRLVRGDAALVQALLAETGNDAQRLERLLAAVGGDAGRLRNLVAAAGGDAARLDRFLAAAGGSAERMQQLLVAAGGDAARLDRLLTAAGGDAQRMLQLVADCGGNAALADRLLTAAGGNAAEVENIVRLAGGHVGSASLERLFNLSQEDLARLRPLLNQANGDAAELQRFAEAAGRFARQPAPPVAEPADLHGFTGADMPHFLERHTFDFFDFADPIGPPNTTFWPEGTTPAQIGQRLQMALDELARQGRLPQAFQPQRVVVDGFEVQVGSRAGGGGLEIGQFFPTANNPACPTFGRAVMNAFRTLFGL